MGGGEVPLLQPCASELGGGLIPILLVAKFVEIPSFHLSENSTEMTLEISEIAIIYNFFVPTF